MKRAEITGHFEYVIGEKAKEAVDYILDEEDRMNHFRAGNFYFSEDYAKNMIGFYKEAIEKFDVRIFDSFSDREICNPT